MSSDHNSGNPATTGNQPDALPAAVTGNFSAWFRSWRYFFWLLGLALLVALFYGEENWRGRRSWQNYQQKLRTRGEVVDAKTLVPPPVPDEKNFAMTSLLGPLFEFIPGTQHWRDTNAMKRAGEIAPRYDAAARALKLEKSVRSNSWIAPRTDMAAWQKAFLQPTNRADSAETDMVANLAKGSTLNSSSNVNNQEAAMAVLAALSECDTLIEELRVDSKRPYSRFNIRYNEDNPAAILLPHLAVLKHLCQIVQLRASAELALGRIEEAFADVNLMFRLIDASREESIVISQLVRMALLQLTLQPIAEGMHAWSEPQLRALEERLQRFDFCTDVKHTLEAERIFFGGGVIDFIRRSPGTFDAIANEAVLPGVVWAIAPNGWFDLEKLNYSRLFEGYLTPRIDLINRRISPSAALAADERIAREARKSPAVLFLRHRVLSGLLMPTLSNVFRKAAFAQTGADVAAIACALERFRRAKGEFPESLEALNPMFMEKLPHDIINGQPLKYRRIEDRQFALYSVGWNETDDGGTVMPGKAERAAEQQAPPEGDWVWREQ
jgi:hypothetical protein